MLTLDLFAV